MSGTISVCLICTFYPPASFGGDAVHAQRLARGLALRGHRVRVLHNPAAHVLLGGMADAGADSEDHGVEVVPVPLGPAARLATAATYLGGQPVLYRRRLQELTAGFDVIQFNNPSLLGGPGALGMGDPTSVRLYTTHEHWLVCPTHTLFRYEREVCVKRTCWRCTASYRRPPQLWRSTDLLRRQLDHVDVLLAPSRFTAGLHREALPGARVEVLPPLGPSFADIRTISRHSLGVRTDRPFFLFAGRLESIKGIDRLARAFSAVRGADLLVVGAGSLAGELRQLAANNPSIQLWGRRNHDEVLALAGLARAVIVPSAGYETFGMSAIEAMVVGTPVVVRALGPLPELVEAGGGIAVADDGDMAQAMQQLVDRPESARRLGEEARAFATSTFSDEAIFRRYFEIIADVAARRGKSVLSERSSAASRAE